MKTLILILLLIPQTLMADLWENHAKPTLTNGWDLKGFMIIGAGLGAVAYTQPQDDEFAREWGSHKKISKENSKVGDIMGMGIPGIAIALTQLIVDNENGIAHSEALVATFVTTSVLKIANNRPRPNGLNRRAMPSGHTSTTFASATALSYAYGWIAAVPAYAAATFTALTRVSDDAHWLSDTVAGAAVGIFWGRASHFHHENGSSGAIGPMYLEGGMGLQYVGRF